MCIHYKGCNISEDISPKFGTVYYSVTNPHLRMSRNPKHLCHAHSNTLKGAKAIINCYIKLKTYGIAYKCQRTLKNKALRLMDIYVMY